MRVPDSNDGFTSNAQSVIVVSKEGIVQSKTNNSDNKHGGFTNKRMPAIKRDVS